MVITAEVVGPVGLAELGAVDEVAGDDQVGAVAALRRLLEGVGDAIEIGNVALDISGNEEPSPIGELEDATHGR